MVYEKAYISNDPTPHDNETGVDAMAGDGGYKLGTLHGVIRAQMQRQGKRFWAGDNISDYVDRKSTRLNSSHVSESRMPSSA